MLKKYQDLKYEIDQHISIIKSDNNIFPKYKKDFNDNDKQLYKQLLVKHKNSINQLADKFMKLPINTVFEQVLFLGLWKYIPYVQNKFNCYLKSKIHLEELFDFKLNSILEKIQYDKIYRLIDNAIISNNILNIFSLFKENNINWDIYGNMEIIEITSIHKKYNYPLLWDRYELNKLPTNIYMNLIHKRFHRLPRNFEYLINAVEGDYEYSRRRIKKNEINYTKRYFFKSNDLNENDEIISWINENVIEWDKETQLLFKLMWS